MSIPQVESTDAVVIVDVQNDFCPGGALPVHHGERVVSALNRWIEAAEQHGAMIVASRDWHPSDHASFQSREGPWPAHCIQNSRGSEFHPDLKLAGNVTIVNKGMARDRDQYSCFDSTGLVDELKKNGIRRLWIGGLAEDVCVCATVLDGLKSGFEVHLIKDATCPLNEESGEVALQKMRAAGCLVDDGDYHD